MLHRIEISDGVVANLSERKFLLKQELVRTRHRAFARLLRPGKSRSFGNLLLKVSIQHARISTAHGDMLNSSQAELVAHVSRHSPLIRPQQLSTQVYLIS